MNEIELNDNGGKTYASFVTREKILVAVLALLSGGGGGVMSVQLAQAKSTVKIQANADHIRETGSRLSDDLKDVDNKLHNLNEKVDAQSIKTERSLGRIEGKLETLLRKLDE